MYYRAILGPYIWFYISIVDYSCREPLRAARVAVIPYFDIYLYFTAAEGRLPPRRECEPVGEPVGRA